MGRLIGKNDWATMKSMSLSPSQIEQPRLRIAPHCLCRSCHWETPLLRENQGGAPFCFIFMKLHLDTSEVDFQVLFSLDQCG